MGVTLFAAVYVPGISPGMIIYSRVSRMVAAVCGGKSGLHRAGRQITSGGREPTESATENIPPGLTWGSLREARVRVKWCGKGAPRCR